METLEARFQIVTPMFLGGADQGVADGIRPPSVKGALRFWWRALNWGRCRKDSSCDEAALILLHQEESRLFGSAADDNGGGQGCFLLTVNRAQIQQIQPDINRTSGKGYLAGLGLRGRSALDAGGCFSLSLRFKPGTSDTAKKSLAETVRCLGIMGGLGSRSRRGYGSIFAMRQGDNDNGRLPTEAEFAEERAWLKTMFLSGSPTSNPFSCLDSSAQLYKGSEKTTWSDAMDIIGKTMNRFRTNGTSLMPGAHPRPAAPGCRIVDNRDVPITPLNFRFLTTDHHRVYSVASTRTIIPPNAVPPERAIFGIPHPYLFSSLGGRKVSFDFNPNWLPGNSSKGRRASPLFVHIAAYTNARNEVRYQPLLLLLPSQFLPANSRLEVSVEGRSVGSVPSPTNYSPIVDFLTTHFTAC